MPESHVSSNTGPVIGAFLLILITILLIINWRKPELPSNNTIEDSRATFAKLINSSNYRSFGLENPDQINTLETGNKFKKYFIELQSLKYYNGSDPVNAIVNRHYSVEVPLLNASKKIITSMEFSKNTNDNWEAVGFGLSSSFRKLAESGINAAADDLTMVEIPALNMDFIIFKEFQTNEVKRLILVPWPALEDSTKENLIRFSKYSSFESDSALLKHLQNMAVNLKNNFPG